MSSTIRPVGFLIVGLTLAACSAPPATGTGGQSLQPQSPSPPSTEKVGAPAVEMTPDAGK